MSPTSTPSSAGKANGEGGEVDEGRCERSSESVFQKAEALKKDGNLKFGEKEYKRATELYSAAVNLQGAEEWSGLGTCLTNMAASQLAIGAYNDARASATRALELEPENLKAIYRLACASEKLGRTKDAYEALTRGTALDDGLYSDKSKKKLVKVIRRTRAELLASLPEEPIENYAFSDEGKPVVKVYVNLPGVGMLPRSDIECSFGRKTLDLWVRGYEGAKNMRLFAAELWSDVEVGKCKIRIKPDKLVLSLRKLANDGMRPWQRLRRG